MNHFSSFFIFILYFYYFSRFFEKALEMYTKMVYINLVKNSIKLAEAILLNFKMKKVETWTD